MGVDALPVVDVGGLYESLREQAKESVVSSFRIKTEAFDSSVVVDKIDGDKLAVRLNFIRGDRGGVGVKVHKFIAELHTSDFRHDAPVAIENLSREIGRQISDVLLIGRMRAELSRALGSRR